jgi:hypothetical protein
MFRYLGTVKKLFLPREKAVSLKFLQDMIRGKKLFYFQRDVPQYFVEKWEELSIKNIWPLAC